MTRRRGPTLHAMTHAEAMLHNRLAVTTAAGADLAIALAGGEDRTTQRRHHAKMLSQVVPQLVHALADVLEERGMRIEAEALAADPADDTGPDDIDQADEADDDEGEDVPPRRRGGKGFVPRTHTVRPPRVHRCHAEH